MARPKKEQQAQQPTAGDTPDIRRAIGILARYLTERDQIKPHGPDSEIYWLAEKFKD